MVAWQTAYIYIFKVIIIKYFILFQNSRMVYQRAVSALSAAIVSYSAWRTLHRSPAACDQGPDKECLTQAIKHCKNLLSNIQVS